MKTEELRQELGYLEQDVRKLLIKFIEKNGPCDFTISADIYETEVDDKNYHSPEVTIKITI